MYFGVIYCNDGTIHLKKGSTKESCENGLFEMLKDKRIYDRTVRTTVIKRDTDTDFIFGSPESLNMKAKFDKLLKKGKVEFK